MIIFFFAAESLAKFLELMKQGLLDWKRPERCRCGEKDCFWVHGSYWRIVEEYELSEKIEIKRYKCQWCGVTVSLLPCFVIPQWHSLKHILESFLFSDADFSINNRFLAWLSTRSHRIFITPLFNCTWINSPWSFRNYFRGDFNQYA
jgi:hypothetical protein